MTRTEGGGRAGEGKRGRLEAAIAALREHTSDWPNTSPGAASPREVCAQWERWLDRRERLLRVLAECPWEGPEAKDDSIREALRALLEAEEQARQALLAHVAALRGELFRRARAARARTGYRAPGKARRASGLRGRGGPRRVNRRG